MTEKYDPLTKGFIAGWEATTNSEERLVLLKQILVESCIVAPKIFTDYGSISWNRSSFNIIESLEALAELFERKPTECLKQAKLICIDEYIRLEKEGRGGVRLDLKISDDYMKDISTEDYSSDELYRLKLWIFRSRIQENFALKKEDILDLIDKWRTNCLTRRKEKKLSGQSDLSCCLFFTLIVLIPASLLCIWLGRLAFGF